MAVFRCTACGYEKEGRCKPENAQSAVGRIPSRRKSCFASLSMVTLVDS